MLEKIVYEKKEDTIQAVDQICHRCLGHDLYIAQNQHAYCQECSQLRPLSDFLYLKRYKRTVIKKQHQVKINISLSKSQLLGQAFIDHCYSNNISGFLHAVCGAGKTEMLIHTMAKALNEGKSLCFVIPRVEIIKQLHQRLKSYLPKTKICPLYQGQSLDENAHLFITTPQQLVKFYQEFDLMFLDEVDAFPFYQNAYLERLVEKAKADHGKLIYLSATCPPYYQDKINRYHWSYFLIPERFHGHDLVIPRFRKYHYMMSDDVFKDIQTYHDHKQRLIVFFPSIHLMTRYHYFLRSKKLDVLMISSKTSNKANILKRFSRHEVSLLLSTTILERGVTFKNSHVFVFEADHAIYDQYTLIQIAGRVGRDMVYHQGELVFYSCFISQAMYAAKKTLKTMNRIKTHDL